MNIFWVFNGNKLKRIFILLITCVFAVAVFYAEKEDITVFSQNEPPSAISSVTTTKPWIALTFDISWGEHNAEQILEALQEEKVDRATFFLSSIWSKDHPEIVQKIIEAGYEIGSHGHRHMNYSELDDEDIRKQMTTANRILTELTGHAIHLIRLPNGDWDRRVLRIADELGYQVIGWDTNSNDWKNPGVEQIVKTVISNAHKGNIVLLHASDSSQQTAEALPIIIKQLRAKSYTFVTVSEMLDQAQIDRKPVRDPK